MSDEHIDRDTHDHDMTYENEQSTVTIPLKEYDKLKEYYDFQRKKEFNREQLQDAMTHIEEKLGIMTLSFDEIWSRLDEKDYQETPNNWVPRDPKWRIQGE